MAYVWSRPPLPASAAPDERVTAYVENCEALSLPVDPAVVTTLASGWHTVTTSRRLTSSGSLLPLVGVLDEDPNVSTLAVRWLSPLPQRAEGDANARALARVLAANTALTSIDLCGNGIGEAGVLALAEALRSNKTLTSLDLSHNYFTGRSCTALAAALKANGSRTLTRLNVSRNLLMYGPLLALKQECVGTEVAGNHVAEEILNSTSHFAGFLASLVGGYALTNRLDAALAAGGASHADYWACLVYSVSLPLLFLCSTLFHSFFMMPTAYRVFQVLDHAGIYLLIAGTYTPVVQLGLKCRAARLMLLAQWVLAACGIAFTSCKLPSKVTMYVELALYLVMGCAVLALPASALANMDPDAFYLVQLGGVCYVGGTVFFVAGDTRPIWHCGWHLAVLGGAAFHWAAIYCHLARDLLPEGGGGGEVAAAVAASAAIFGGAEF